MKTAAKYLALVLCLALFAVMFSACGPKTPESSATPTADVTAGSTDAATPAPSDTPVPEARFMKSGETYRILIWNTTYENQPLDQDGIRGSLLKEAYDEMKAVYGVTPLYIAAPADWWGETMSSTHAGTPITDLFHIGGPFTLPNLYTYGGEKGAILEAASDYDVDFSDPEYWDVTSEEVGTFGGKHYLISPNAMGFDAASLNVVTIFNKSIMSKAGFPDETLYDLSESGEWTFAKFREAALAATDLDAGVYGTSTVQNCYLMSSMIVSNNSDMFVKKDGSDVFNMLDSKALEAVNYLVEMTRDDKSVLVDISGEEDATFAAGALGMIVTYANRAAKDTIAKLMTDDYGVIMPPKGPQATEYVSDKNWFDGYLVMKNISNPAGAFEFASIFMKPAYAMSSDLQAALLVAQATAYRMDERSIETLKKIPSVSHTTSYTIFWQAGGAGNSVAELCNYVFPQFVDGSLSPDTYYASVESKINATIAAAMGDL